MDSRRQHRIVYQTKIRLRAPGKDDSVVARVQNLSPRGVFVTASEIPEAGTEVQCRLTLAGERRTLRGRVAWVRPASPSTPLRSPGAGIEFLDLGERDADLLHRLVEPSDEERQPVDVWFEGMKGPIRCQALVVGEGVRLATRLPFMRLNSPVRVAFTEGTAAEPTIREGTLESVMLEPNNEDGIPHLQLNVSMAGLDSAQGTIDTAGVEATLHGLPAMPTPSTVVDPAMTAPPPVFITVPRTDQRDPDSTLRVSPPPPPGPLLTLPRAPAGRRALTWLSKGWRPAVAGFVGGALAVGLLSAALRAEQQPPVAVARVVAAPAPEPAPLPAAEPATRAEPAMSAAPAPEPAPEPANTAEEGAPALVSGADGTKLVVPMAGNTKSSDQYRLADPPGIAITMPRARPRLATGVYRPGGGPVRLQVRRRGAGSHMRFFFDPTPGKGKLLVEDDKLILDLGKR